MAKKSSEQREPTKLREKGFQEVGDTFLKKIVVFLRRSEMQAAADDLTLMLIWPKDGQKIGKRLRRQHPFQLVAMGILMGKHGGAFPFTSAKEVRAYAREGAGGQRTHKARSKRRPVSTAKTVAGKAA
jgi:hypothetical protein